MTPEQQQIFDEFVQEMDAMFADWLAKLQSTTEHAFGNDKELVELLMRRQRAQVMAYREQKLAQLEAKFEARRH